MKTDVSRTENRDKIAPMYNTLSVLPKQICVK